jgi:hypothetical protein
MKLAVLGLIFIACTTLTKEATLLQTNPLENKVPPYRSLPVVITIKDHEISNRFKLLQSAYFVILSRDKIKVRVLLSHKWREMVNLREWEAELTTSAGTYKPSTLEVDSPKLYVKLWEELAFRNMIPLVGVDAFIGVGELYFSGKGLIGNSTEFVACTISHRSGIKYTFRWEFTKANDSY